MASPDRKNKSFGIKRIFASVKNSWNGLKVAYKNEQSVYIHLVCTVILLLLSFLLKISLTQWLIIIAIIGLTLVVELINTAIESTVDLVTEGILTLTKTSEYLEANPVQVCDDAAGKLVKFFLNSDVINFMVGAKLNQAHYDPNLPIEIEIRKNIVKKIAKILEEKFFKRVSIQYM